MKQYCVYIHHLIREDLYYIGVTCRSTVRFNNSLYIGTALYPYLDLSIPFKQNPNIETDTGPSTLTYEQSRFVEDILIRNFHPDKVINRQKSGLDRNSGHYHRLRYNDKKNDEAYIEKCRQDAAKRRSTPWGKIYDRVHAYNQNHTPIETPLEAKQKYLEWGYIPNYIKNSDLLKS